MYNEVVANTLENKSEDESPLNALINYRLINQYKSPVLSTIFKYPLIILDSAFSVWLYVNPALEYAGDSIPFKIVFVSGCVGANFALTFWAADSTFEYIKSLFKDKKIAELTDKKQNPIAKAIGYTALIIGGFLPSLLPAAAALQLGGGSLTYRRIEAVTVLFGNLPLNTYGLLNFIKERGPVIKNIFSIVFCWKYFCHLDPLYLNYKSQTNLLKNKLIATLRSAQDIIINNRELPNLNIGSPLEVLQSIALKAFPKEEQLEENSMASKCFSSIRTVIGLFGAGLGMADFPGYIMATKHMVDSYISNESLAWVGAGAINFIPIYMSATLGFNTFTTILDTLTNFCRRKHNYPLSFLVYPLQTSGIMLIAATLAFFSYCTSVQLVKQNFAESLYDYLAPLARASITMFNMYGSIGFSNFLILFYTKNFGRSDKKALVKFNEGMDLLISDIEGMSEKYFIESLTKMPEQISKDLLGEPFNANSILIKPDNKEEKISEKTTLLFKNKTNNLFDFLFWKKKSYNSSSLNVDNTDDQDKKLTSRKKICCGIM